jgi:hypothetical protein
VSTARPCPELSGEETSWVRLMFKTAIPFKYPYICISRPNKLENRVGPGITLFSGSGFIKTVYSFWYIHFKTGTMLEFPRFFYRNIRNGENFPA